MNHTDEELAWDQHQDRQNSITACHKKDVFDQLDLVPSNSVLYPEYPRLLRQACSPQSAVVYDPALREFGLMETWGPATISIDHCPFTGKKLPAPLRDAWFDTISELLGTDDWSFERAKDQLPRKYFNEDWWIELKL